MQYVVYSEPPRGERPFDQAFKVFARQEAASQFAAEHVSGDAAKATIYGIDVVGVRAAIEGVKMGEGHFIDEKVKKSIPGVDRPFTADELGF